MKQPLNGHIFTKVEMSKYVYRKLSFHDLRNTYNDFDYRNGSYKHAVMVIQYFSVRSISVLLNYTVLAMLENVLLNQSHKRTNAHTQFKG